MPLRSSVAWTQPAGRPASEHVAHRRKINQVNAALVLPNIPGMGVPEDIGFDLLSGPNDLKEGGGVFQPDVSAEARIVMNQHQRGFVGVGIERARQPIQLFLAQQAGRREGLFERVEHEPIRPRGAQQRDLPVSQRPLGGLFLPARPPRSARGYRGCPTPDAPASGRPESAPASPPPGVVAHSARCCKRNRR